MRKDVYKKAHLMRILLHAPESGQGMEAYESLLLKMVKTASVAINRAPATISGRMWRTLPVTANQMPAPPITAPTIKCVDPT